MKKTKKLLIVLAIVFSMSLSIAACPVSASAHFAPDAEPTHTATQAEVRALYAMVNTANTSIRLAVRIAQLTPYDDVDALLRTTNAIVSAVKAYAEAIGAEVECEYTEYTIDGRKVMIDPLRVVNIPGTGGGGGGGGNAPDGDHITE